MARFLLGLALGAISSGITYAVTGSPHWTAIVGVNSPAQTEMGPLIGNIRTMVYHDVNNDQELPSEENRIYFASEAEAISAGYRADSAELASRSTEASEPGE